MSTMLSSTRNQVISLMVEIVSQLKSLKGVNCDLTRIKSERYLVQLSAVRVQLFGETVLMPQFFVPLATDAAQAESVRDSTIKFAEEQTGWKVSPRRIYSLRYRHDGKLYQDVVGEVSSRIGETVLVILESDTFFVCSQNYCVATGFPCMVGKDEVNAVVDFDVPAPGAPLAINKEDLPS
jgi:hypothetical protein